MSVVCMCDSVSHIHRILISFRLANQDNVHTKTKQEVAQSMLNKGESWVLVGSFPCVLGWMSTLKYCWLNYMQISCKHIIMENTRLYCARVTMLRPRFRLILSSCREKICADVFFLRCFNCSRNKREWRMLQWRSTFVCLGLDNTSTYDEWQVITIWFVGCDSF